MNTLFHFISSLCFAFIACPILRLQNITIIMNHILNVSVSSFTIVWCFALAYVFFFKVMQGTPFLLSYGINITAVTLCVWIPLFLAELQLHINWCNFNNGLLATFSKIPNYLITNLWWRRKSKDLLSTAISCSSIQQSVFNPYSAWSIILFGLASLCQIRGKNYQLKPSSSIKNTSFARQQIA